MSTQHYICKLEGALNAAVELFNQTTDTSQWQLSIKLFHNNVPVGSTQFTLNGYSKTEAEDIAKNIRTNPFIMREIDEYLWGEMD